MIDPKKHTINFQVKKRINWFERIYIKGNIPELGSMDPRYAVPMNVMDEELWSADVRIDPNQKTPGDAIQYEYFIASFDDPLQNVREFQVSLRRELSLSTLRDRYMHIRDEWQVEGDFHGRVRIFNPKDRVFLNFKIKKEIYYGEAIYIVGPLEALADQEAGRISAVRMEWSPEHVWKGTFDIGLDQIFALNGKLTFAFYRSYYYKRCINEWRLVDQFGNTYKTNEIEMIRKLWNDQNVGAPLWIDIVADDQNIQYPDSDKPPRLLNFVYENPYDEDPESIVAVYVICKAFNPMRMERRTRTKWHAEVWVSESRIVDGGLIDDFYFDVHRGPPPSNQIEPQVQSSEAPITRLIETHQIVKGNFSRVNGAFEVLAEVPKRTFEESKIEAFSQSVSLLKKVNFGNSYKPRRREFYSPSTSSFDTSTSSFGTSTSPSGIYTSSCVGMMNLVSNISYNWGSYSTSAPRDNPVVQLSQQIQEVSSNMYNAVKFSSSFYHTVVNAPALREPVNLKEKTGITNLAKHWKLVRIAVSKLEVKEDDGKKLIKDLAQDTSFIEELLQLNSKQKKEIDGIEGDNLQILRIQILVLAKSWALDKFSDKLGEEIFKKLNEFLELDKLNPTIVVNACLEVNAYCRTHFTKEVKEGHNNCQNSMQAEVDKNFGNYKYEKTQVQQSSIYKNLFEIVTGDLTNFLLFAQEQGLAHLKWDQNLSDENFILRLLINYAILYSVSRHCNKNIPAFSTCGCARFGPYCEETIKMALNRQDLTLLQEKYLSMKQVRTKRISLTEEEIVKKEEEIIKKFEKTTGREVVAITHIVFDLENLKEMISNGVHTMSIDVVIQDVQELEKEIDAIDEIKDSERKLVKIKDLKNHKSLESIVRIHDAFTD